MSTLVGGLIFFRYAFIACRHCGQRYEVSSSGINPMDHCPFCGCPNKMPLNDSLSQDDPSVATAGKVPDDG